MSDANGKLKIRALVGLSQLMAVLGLVLFLSAGTLGWAEAWAFLCVFFVSSLVITVYLMRRDPELLGRRVRAGPVAESRPLQKLVQAFASAAFLCILAVPGFDRRFGWSSVSLPWVVVGEMLIVVGFAIVFFVFKANSYAAAVVVVGPDQRVIDTGPYARIRHPMYAGALVLLAGIPLALGSFWGLAVLVPFTAILIWRLLDEERLLSNELSGYEAYCRRVRYRLLPYVW